LGAPVLIAAGSADQHTTLAESQQLFDAASNLKDLWTVAGAKHQDLLNYDKAQYEAHVVRFLIHHLRTTPVPTSAAAHAGTDGHLDLLGSRAHRPRISYRSIFESAASSC
jgi:hypothetical protein